MRHTSHIRQKWGNQKMKIVKFSNLCLVSANTFDVSNRLFLFHPALGLSKKVLRSFIAILQLDISNRDIRWFLKILKISIFFAKIPKGGQKAGFFWPLLTPTFQLWSGARFWYLATLKYRMWTTKKCIVRQCMCTHVAHTLKFSKNEKKIEKISSCGNPVCRSGVHTFSHYTFFSRPNTLH